MAADWWARGIAIGSAAAATVNMTVAYRTFRRVRPKIKVRLWRTGLAAYEAGDNPAQHQFILRFLNNGTTPVSVERIELWTYLKRYRRGYIVHGKRFERGFPNYEPPVVPALDGTTYRYNVPRSAKPDDDMRMRFRVLLSNGRVAVSPLVPSDTWFFADEVGVPMESHMGEDDE